MAGGSGGGAERGAAAVDRPPAWTEVRVLVPIGWEELVAECLARPPCTTVVFGRPSLGTDAAPEGFEWLRTFLVEGDDDAAARAAIAERLGSLAGATGAEELRGLEPSFRRLPAEDWAVSWRKSWKPMRVGRLCLVPPDWDRPLRAGDVRLVLEPGGAFGTGRHATTRGCLRALQERPLTGARVLDAGCGSGVLGVAALLLGADHVLAFDNDPNALPYARHLFEANGVADRADLRVAAFEDLRGDEGAFDLVLANIYADVIELHAGDLARRLVPGGRFVFSGCPVDKLAGVRAAVAAAGLELGAERTRGRWVTLTGRRPGPAGGEFGS